MSGNTFFQPYVDLLNRILAVAIEKPLLFVIQAFVTICLITRRWTAFQKSYRQPDPSLNTQAIPRVPYWIPFVANTLSFSSRSQSWLLSQAKAQRAGVFALRIYGRDHVIVASPMLCAALSDSDSLSSELSSGLRSRRFFDNPHTDQAMQIRNREAVASFKLDRSRVRKLLKLLEANTYNLISSSRSWVDQAQWERTAEVNVITEDPELSVSANINILIRDFVSHMFFSVLLGSSFVEANPDLLPDFFYFSSKYSTFMTGLPYWIGPGLGPPARAREKCLLTLDGLVHAIIADTERTGGSALGVGMLYDVQDVHPAVVKLVKSARQHNRRAKNVRSISCEVLQMLFYTTFHDVNLVVWMIIYLFMKGEEYATTLTAVKEEITAIVRVEKPPPSGLPFQEPPRLKFKTEIVHLLAEKCPMLTATLSEVQRLEAEYEDYFVVEKDFVLKATTDDKQDSTAGESKKRGGKFELWQGDRVYAAYGATNKDPQYWDRPRRFVPSRFMSKSEAETDTSIAVWKSLPSRGGLGEVGGELLLITAALLLFFEFTSMDGSGLSHPGCTIVAGMATPVRTVTGKIQRRQF
ncbi:hypothetical protein LTR05_002616 [Lithohypha guttulata]|uniref:Cytochrome P450 n=1 Tax=Lithohypha guttulata TaxID=1690604 RepID=A0AAN7T4L4_9EURO|nr:hypothetical protein LTR05_002616 [Lithohypha guttulata]